MKKRPALDRAIPSVAFSLALILTLSACAGPDTSIIGNDASFASGPANTETNLNDESLFETVFSQSDPADRGRITYYRDKVTDVLYVKVFSLSHTGYAGAGGLTVMLDPDSGKPLTYARYMELYSALHS